MWTTTTIIFTILFIAVVVCLIIGFNGYWQWILAALVLLVLTLGMAFMLGISTDTELSSKDMMYSSPLVSINDASKGDVIFSNNVYVVENNDGEYIFYTLGYMDQNLKQCVPKENVIIETNNDVIPFIEGYKETYVSKNIFGDVYNEYTVEKYYLTIPKNAIVTDSLSDLV